MTTPQENNQCDAIIFIPGLIDELTDQSLDGIAQRISVALKCKTSTQAKFRTETQEYNPESTQIISTENSPSSKAQMIRISIEGSASVNATVDVYKLNYNNDFTQNYNNSTLLYKVFRLLVLLIYGIPVLVSSLLPKNNAKSSPNNAKSSPEKRQLLFATLLFLFFVIYMIILIIAVFDIFLSLTKHQHNSITIPQEIIVISTFLESFFPNLRQFFEKIIINYICLLEYLSFGERHNVISGQLTNLLEYLGEKGIYQHVHIVSYSFGTIIAFDNLFPFNRIPRSSQIVDTLVTIACPFDIIRLFWQGYFSQRQMLLKKIPRWINLYNPIDILSSNFRDNEQLGEAQVGTCLANSDIIVKPDENIVYIEGINIANKPNLLSLLLLLGIRSHFSYWRRKYENEENCFSVLIAAIYSDNRMIG